MLYSTIIKIWLEIIESGFDFEIFCMIRKFGKCYVVVHWICFPIFLMNILWDSIRKLWKWYKNLWRIYEIKYTRSVLKWDSWEFFVENPKCTWRLHYAMAYSKGSKGEDVILDSQENKGEFVGEIRENILFCFDWIRDLTLVSFSFWLN